ncbi:MAG: hypothetical protein IKH33_03405 [Bacteroidales bacterium]|nr:hypothetical protein [Bacteroidales bacterium]
MNTIDYIVSITTKDGVKYYNVPLSLEQIAWLIQKQTVPEVQSENNSAEVETNKIDALIASENEVCQGVKSILNSMNSIMEIKVQQDSFFTELSKLNDLVCSLPNGQSLDVVTNTIQTIKELQEKLATGFSQLADSIRNNINQLQQKKQPEMTVNTARKTDELSTELSNTLNNISFNIDQLSRTITAQTSSSSNSNELCAESVYQRLMYKLVEMPVKLYERTAKRLLYKKENNPEYDGNELELILSFLRRNLDSIGLTAIISKLGTAFDASTMEVDDEHVPISILGQESNTVAYTVLPRLVWRASSGLPESMLSPEKVILCE